ncbi:HAMP domain-containing protein [Candidatus Bipolaricaulota bacterium]|nr:HAMP domain-containing protein [Candidatus Bipolaricaulota bacterium]MBS3793196.1 HAMP domain-containing protein [Candidatus Bipolaricaulota bacterium]
MIYSLRWKLLVGFILVVSLAIGTVGFIATRTTKREFDRYISQDKALKYQRLALTLSSYYEETGSWKGVQNLIDKIKQTYNTQIVLTDPKGAVITDSSGQLTGESFNKEFGLKIATIGERDNPFGFLYLKDRKRSEIENVFLSSVNNSIIMAAVVSVLAAIALIFYYSRKTLNPIKELTAAAERIKEGHLNQEVKVKTRDEVGTLASAFNSMAQELRKQERLRKNMVSDVAHELRSPLTKSHGYLEAIKEGRMEPDQETIEALYRNSKALKKLVDDLNDLTRAEAGQLDLERKPILLQEVTESTRESIQFMLNEKDLKLKVDLPDDVLVYVDPDRIQQVLRNLLDNAIAYSKQGGTIRTTAKTQEDQVEIRVEDNGEGIPKSDLRHIFDRFYRVDRSRSRETGGSGLGLTIAREIIEAHGGKIEAESEKGEGTTLIFTLPRTDD